MAYTPVPTDPTNPLDTTDRSTAAAEFRALKTFIQGLTNIVSASAIPDIFNNTNALITFSDSLTVTGFAAAPQAGCHRTLIISSATQFTAGANLQIDGVASGTTITVAANTILQVYALSTTSFRISTLNLNGITGELRQWTGPAASIPVGWMQVPNAPTNLSRTTYAGLFALWGTMYGAGDGVTTFGSYYIPVGYTPAQVNGGDAGLGAVSVGQVINHVHPVSNVLTNIAATAVTHVLSDGGSGFSTGNPTTGGAANYAASVGTYYIIKT